MELRCNFWKLHIFSKFSKKFKYLFLGDTLLSSDVFMNCEWFNFIPKMILKLL
jgi:hypothetical protein